MSSISEHIGLAFRVEPRSKSDPQPASFHDCFPSTQNVLPKYTCTHAYTHMPVSLSVTEAIHSCIRDKHYKIHKVEREFFPNWQASPTPDSVSLSCFPGADLGQFWKPYPSKCSKYTRLTLRHFCCCSLLRKMALRLYLVSFSLLVSLHKYLVFIFPRQHI